MIPQHQSATGEKLVAAGLRMKRHRSCIHRVATLCLLAVLLLGRGAWADDGARDFVERFMQAQVDYWTLARYSRTDMLSFVSKRYMYDRKIDPRKTNLNKFVVTGFAIVSEHGPFFDVSVSSDLCSPNCPESHIVRLKIVRELNSFAIVPRKYKKGSDYVNYWWDNMHDKFRSLSRKERAEKMQASTVPDDMMLLWHAAVENDTRDTLSRFREGWEANYRFRRTREEWRSRQEPGAGTMASALIGTDWRLPANYVTEDGYSERDAVFRFLESGAVTVFDEVSRNGKFVGVSGRWSQDESRVLVSIEDGRLYSVSVRDGKLYSERANIVMATPLEGWVRDDAASVTAVAEELPSSGDVADGRFDEVLTTAEPLEIFDDVEEVVSLFRPLDRLPIDPFVNVHGRLLAVRDSRLLLEGWGRFNVDKRVKISCPLEEVSDLLLDIHDDLIRPEEMPNHIGQIRQVIWRSEGCTLHDQRRNKRYREREAETLERALHASSLDARRMAAAQLNEADNLVMLLGESDDAIFNAIASLRLLTLDDKVMFGLPRLRVFYARNNRTQIYVVEGTGTLVNVEGESLDLRLEFGNPIEIIHQHRFEMEFPQRLTRKSDLDVRGMNIRPFVDVIIRRAGLINEDIVRLARSSDSPIIRASMIPHIDDEELLFRLAFDDPDPFARRDAAALVRSPSLVEKIVLDHPDFLVRIQTVGRVTDPTVLRQVLEREQSTEIIEQAEERLRELDSIPE